MSVAFGWAQMRASMPFDTPVMRFSRFCSLMRLNVWNREVSENWLEPWRSTSASVHDILPRSNRQGDSCMVSVLVALNVSTWPGKYDPKSKSPVR